MTYKEALKLSTQLWIWLYKNPGKDKKDSPYWNAIKDMWFQCPMCEFFHIKVYNRCDGCPINEAGENCIPWHSTFHQWSDPMPFENCYEQVKKAAARIASILRREYEKVTGDKKAFRRNK